ADILEVFFKAGVDTVMGLADVDPLADAVKEAEDRTGVKGIMVSTPHFPISKDVPAKGLDPQSVDQILDTQVKFGARFCFPHQAVTDALVDRCSREIRQIGPLMKKIRERGMIPGLSTHMPEAIIYADETGIDVETYIALYNSMGFLMPVEVDWAAYIIRNAKKPVMTIKPMAAGQLRPFQGLTFVWNTIRPQDMVTVGTMTPDEAREVIAISLEILEGKKADLTLQETRSKASIKSRK
ncbi:MAG: hypothetical protein Q8O57_03015, partial [Kiritimatiellota bacterium]|nr:hypothetical protein [Kiritimatiellota bacterium]